MSEQHGDDIAGQQTSADDDGSPPADTEVDTQDKQMAEEPLTTPGISPVYLESFDSKYVHQALPDFEELYGDFLGRVITGIAAASGTHPALTASLLPGLVAGCIGPGLKITPNSSSSWVMKLNFWPAAIAESGAGTARKWPKIIN